MRSTAPTLALALALAASARGADGQEAGGQVAAETYARAERFLAEHTESLVYWGRVVPRWWPDGRFWYSVEVPGGSESMLVDPRAGLRVRAFDHERVAAALSAAAGVPADPLGLDVVALELDLELALIDAGVGRFLCRLRGHTCAPAGGPQASDVDRAAVVSPAGTGAAFIRDHDLWYRDLRSGEERRLTWDGEEDFGYATNNAGWMRSDRPVVMWSPGSQKIATFQHDARGVGMMYTTTTNVGHPVLDAWRYPLAGDSLIFRIHRVVIDLGRPSGQEVRRLRMPPDLHRSTCSDHVVCGGTFGDVRWADDGSRFVFVSSSRDHKRAHVRVADAQTGEVRDLFEEVEETFFDSGHEVGGNWRYLSGADQVLWYSQRDDWGHLYLYDGRTGALIRRVTEGAWNVRDVLEVDEEAREVWFRPTDFDPTRSYPIVNYLYPGPMGSSVGTRAFRPSHRDLQAIAELGFVVVELDAMGTPGRSKPFHEAYYGNMGDNGLPDQVTAIRQLADRYSWMDIERVGIYGHSGGGFAAADAILKYTNFYDVAVSQAGNHDNRNYEDDWAEKWQGLLEEYSDGTTNYDNQANQLLAENLVGKLLIAHGSTDTNVPMSNTMLLVDALISANKDFDLLVLPNRGHGFGNEPYMMRRRWDYFVRDLLGAEPPQGYEIGHLERPIS